MRTRAFYDEIDSENVLVRAADAHWARTLDLLGLPCVDGATTMVDDCRAEIFCDDDTGLASLLVSWPAHGTGGTRGR